MGETVLVRAVKFAKFQGFKQTASETQAVATTAAAFLIERIVSAERWMMMLHKGLTTLTLTQMRKGKLTRFIEN